MLTRAGGRNPRGGAEMRLPGQLSSSKKRIDTMEIKEELTKDDIQSILRASKLLSDVSNDLKGCHFAVVD